MPTLTPTPEAPPQAPRRREAGELPGPAAGAYLARVSILHGSGALESFDRLVRSKSLECARERAREVGRREAGRPSVHAVTVLLLGGAGLGPSLGTSHHAGAAPYAPAPRSRPVFDPVFGRK